MPRLIHGLWSMVYGLWSMVYMVYGLYGLWSMGMGVGSLILLRSTLVHHSPSIDSSVITVDPSPFDIVMHACIGDCDPTMTARFLERHRIGAIGHSLIALSSRLDLAKGGRPSGSLFEAESNISTMCSVPAPHTRESSSHNYLLKNITRGNIEDMITY